ncbi:MAG TPA: sterol desaturase family protein [Sphingomicrobium sp.]|nr:sterol desaturase family protein [Sphingomicrobium sp.]
MLLSNLPLGLVLPALALLFAILIEAIFLIERRPLRRAQGILFQFAFLILSGLVAWPLGMLWSANDLQFLPPLQSWAGVWSLPILIVVIDFLDYWEHRFEHRFFWRVHKVHHSPDDLHAANTFGHPLQVIPSKLLIGIPLSFLNAGSLPLWATLVSAIWVFYIHSPIKLQLSKLRWLMVDNHWHRIHHSVEPEHFDKNFAIVFSIWDRMFGTAHKPRPGEWPQVGIDEPPPANLVDYVLMPLRRAAKLPMAEITAEPSSST